MSCALQNLRTEALCHASCNAEHGVALHLALHFAEPANYALFSVLALVVSTIGKPGLAKALHNTVKAVESRNYADAPVSRQSARKLAAA